MRALEEIYRENFFSRRSKLNWRYTIVCNAIKDVLGSNIHSIIDVGCATGGLARELSIRGYQVEGIEGSSHAKKYFQHNLIHVHDLRELISDFSLYKKFDLVLSIEVAEHIEEEYSDNYIKNLDYLTNNLILITAAMPGQQGHYHVNCQLPDYWIKKFQKYNFTFLSELTLRFATYFEPWKKKKGLSFFCENTLIFKKESK